jgi:drug/metabolite transporter superfamily protein YnfA
MDIDVSFLFPLGLVLGTFSLMMIGLYMAGSIFWPQYVQQVKKMIPDVLGGLVLMLVASVIIGAIGAAF